MSRKRKTEPSPLLRRRGETGKGLFPADRHAAVEIVDELGHRLVRVGRFYDELDRTRIWRDRSTVGERVSMYTTEDESGLLFTCPACSDRGVGVYSVSMQRLIDVIDELWQEGAGGVTPTRRLITARAV
ncbi:hypothetical protein [Demequina lutea]|uniref:Uncharacterized protein n=1 Tax=Demequina lutea TaxID=431489 RepID=A0A7Y9Z9U4_9MICO|nr:hypothetical protein [Demequina lutea]NYI41241.1 hypothetical protein [Demequina lutea]